METELEIVVKGLKTSTAKTYENSYVRLRNLLDLPQKKQIGKLSLPGILKRVPDVPNPRSRANMLVVLRKIFNDEKSQEKINALYKIINEQKRQVQIEKNKELHSDLPSYEQLLSELKQIEDPVKYIVNFLMIYVNTRNQDIMTIQVCDKPKEDYEADKNYLILNQGTNKITFIRNVYKTVRKYGPKKNTINSKMLASKIKQFLGEDEEQKPLFVQRNGKPISSSSYTSYIKNFTIKGLSEAQIMKIYMKHIDEKGDYNMLRKASNNRGTSMSTLLSDYDMTNIKEPSTDIDTDINAQ